MLCKRVTLSVAFASMLLLFPATAAANGTEHFGPFPSTTPDNGTCGQPWATDTVDRDFSVHDNGDGTFRVKEQFKNGSFVTTGPASPGACETDQHHGTTVRPGVVGNFTGFLDGTVTSTTYNPNGCSAAGADCTTTQGFLLAVFGASGPATFTCNLGYAGCSFNFEYSSSDKTLTYHHWQDKSDNHGGEQFVGDIANA